MLERGMFGRFLGGGAPVYRAMVRDCMEVCSFVPDASVAHEPATLCERRLPDLPPDVARRRVFPWGGEGRMASVASIFYLLLRYTTCMLAEGTE